MSREIKFRGKRSENGEWITGGFLEDYWIGGDTFLKAAIRCKLTDLYSYPIEVIPETVGQLTGLKDKNGREIYEGMILKHYHKVHIQIDESDKKEFDEFESTDIGKVIFENGCFLFYAENEHGGSVTTTLETHDEFAEYTFEIIGNIFDNPEMIGEGKANVDSKAK